jgi:hypothetical protein
VPRKANACFFPRPHHGFPYAFVGVDRLQKIGIVFDTNQTMANMNKILSKMRTAPHNVRYSDLVKVCEHFFGQARQQGTSHAVYKTPWRGDPRVNIQCGENGKAKVYQVRQILSAIDRLKETEK